MHRATPSELVLRDLIDALLQEDVASLGDRLVPEPTHADEEECAAGEQWYRVDVSDGIVRFRGRDGGALQPVRLSRGPVLHVARGRARAVDPAGALALLAPDAPCLTQVMNDLCQAVEHAAETGAGRAALPDPEPRPGGLVAGEQLAATRNRPFHPTSRAVVGWTAAELGQYGAMRRTALGLDWVAVRRERLGHGSDPASHDLAALLLAEQDRERLTEAAVSLGADDETYQCLPVHPWQYCHVLPRLFRRELVSRDIVLLARDLGRFRPTSSLRTLATDPEGTCHVKLPLGVASLGATRLLPPRYLLNAERAEDVVRLVVDRSPCLRPLVELCDERAWAGWSTGPEDEFADRPGHLAAQVRRYPSDLFADDSTLVLPMGALASHEWGPLGRALAEVGMDPARPHQLFRIVADAFCRMAVGFLAAGVLPELHGQNVVVALRAGRVERFVLRDHDTVRLHRPWMRAAGVPDPGYRIRPGAPQTLTFDEPAGLVAYFQTLGLQVNLYGIADALARHHGLDERELWAEAAAAITDALDDNVPAEIADTLRALVLEQETWPSRQVLAPLLDRGASSGVSMPAATGSVPNPLVPAPTDARARAEAATRRRLLNSYLREAGHDLVVDDAGWASVPVPSRGRGLAIEVRHRSATGLHEYGDRVRWDAATGDPVGFGELVDVLLAEVEAVAERVCGSGVADAEDRRRDLKAQVDGSVAATSHYLAGVVPSREEDPTRRAEQSVLLGHPFHPTPKSTEGFGDDLHRYAPELGATFPLHWYAVSPDVLHERRVAEAAWVPDAVVEAARRSLGHSGGRHVLLPAHPWQVGHLAQRPAVRELVDRGDLMPLGPLGPEVYATSSVRTVCDPQHTTAWKLPLQVRITNFVRNNPVAHLARAMDASALVACLAPQWRHPGFHVLLETGCRTLDPGVVGEELAADLAVLFREHPFVNGSARPRVLAGLLEERAGDAPELVHEVHRATRSGDPGPAQVATWLRQYLRISLLPLLDVFADDGIGFEAHVQNSLLHTVDGWPDGFWVRDMEGASVSRTRLRKPEMVPPYSPLVYDDEEAWLRLRYHLVTNHLGHVVHVLGRYTAAGETYLWWVVGELLGRSGGELATWLLRDATLPAKANLVSRLAGRGERPWFVEVPNPLHDAPRDGRIP